MRAALARTSSAASGLRFCGMIEEPVVNLSDNRMRPGERRGPDHDFLGQPRQMHRADRRSGERLHHEVAVGHGVERIRGRPVEAERLRRHVAVERKRRAGERRGAERRFIQSLARIGEAAAVARRHFDKGEQMMPEGDRLCGLQMGQPRHHGVGMFERLLGERRLVIGERVIELIDGVAHPEPEIGRDLVVARARGMQPPGGRPDQFGEPQFHIHVHVFQRTLEIEFALLDL